MKSSVLKSVDEAERNSSRTEKPLPPGPLPAPGPLPLELESQDDEKMEGPNAFESPPLSKVSEPDLNLLCRSVEAVEVGGTMGGVTGVEVTVVDE